MLSVGGEEFRASVAHPKGLVTHKEVHEKFRGLVEPVLGSSLTEEIAEAVGSIEDFHNVQSLLELFGNAREGRVRMDKP